MKFLNFDNPLSISCLPFPWHYSWILSHYSNSNLRGRPPTKEVTRLNICFHIKFCLTWITQITSSLNNLTISSLHSKLPRWGHTGSQLEVTNMLIIIITIPVHRRFKIRGWRKSAGMFRQLMPLPLPVILRHFRRLVLRLICFRRRKILAGLIFRRPCLGILVVQSLQVQVSIVFNTLIYSRTSV